MTTGKVKFSFEVLSSVFVALTTVFSPGKTFYRVRRILERNNIVSGDPEGIMSWVGRTEHRFDAFGKGEK